MQNTTQQQAIKLFDRKFVANTLRNNRRCPKCRSEYSHNYDKPLGEAHVKSNRPFLLSCGHNMCENCVYHHRQNLICNVCLRPIDIPINEMHQNYNFKVRDYLDMNFFLLGELHHLRYFRRDGSTNNTLMSTNVNQSKPTTVQEIAVLKCSECEQVQAFGICRHCKVYFCKPCFNAVHLHSKVLKKHSLVPLHKDQKQADMPRPFNCRRHRKAADRFCRKCRMICCVSCAKADHSSHGWTSLFDENMSMKDDITGLLEIVKVSRNCLRKAQKDVKAIEMQLEEHATQTFEEVSNFFLQLHSFLQNEELRITQQFNKNCQRPQFQIQETYVKLNESQNALNAIRSNLEFYQHMPPPDIHLRDVISAYNMQLEKLQCQVQISRSAKNPFVFHRPQSFDPQRDLRKDLAKYYSLEYNDPEISIRIGPIYGDLNRSFHETVAQSSMDTYLSLNNVSDSSTEDHKHQNNQKNKQMKQFSQQSQVSGKSSMVYGSPTVESELPSNKSLLPKSKCNSLALISHVNSPDNFYIHMEDSVRQIRELSHKYVSFMQQKTVPKVISEGYYYMAYHVADKQWYRAMLKKILPNDLYQIFLVDIGMDVEVAKQRLCDIDRKHLAIPFAAIRCAIYDIAPVGQVWNEEANNLLIQITRNQPVRLSIVEQIKDKIWKVDLFTTQTAEPISVRDSFLYTGLAREKPRLLNFKLQPKKMSPIARINQRLSKPTFQQGEMLMVRVTHIEDPQEFFITKIDQLEMKTRMWEELNHDYGQENASLQIIFLAPLQLACAVCIDRIWHRASVEEINKEGEIRVRLVDEGSQELVHWRQLYVLQEKFLLLKEFAIKCALADIEPLQENNYSFTEDAIKEFKQLTSNPTLQVAICSAKQGEYKVSLHVTKKHLDINVGAVLAKYGHGISTGEATQAVEVFKSPTRRLGFSDEVTRSALVESSEDPSSANTKSRQNQILKRTAIRITYIANPGEFYIQLTHLVPGITNFHQQIQQAERDVIKPCFNMMESLEQKEWSVGDHCLVYAKYKMQSPSGVSESVDSIEPSILYDQRELYRGIIVSVEYDVNAEQPFKVFMRDIGATIRSISHSELFDIDHKWDRVANAVYRCHLACVEPTGGTPTWSHSSIDYFKHSVSSFESLSATLQGNRAPGSNSMPIVLWGTTTDTSDPLAPCITRYSSINRILVKAGLAHLIERLDIAQQMDKLIQMELAEGEITMEEWFKNVTNNASLRVIDQPSPTRESKDDSFQFSACDISDADFLNDLTQDELEEERTTPSCPPPRAWLKSKWTEKSIFAGYPTYVDYDCIIYMHDADDHQLLTKMRSKIMKDYGKKSLANEPEVEYTTGQACIAMYHLDCNYYRGIIKNRSVDGLYNVQFIDYGNVESIEPSNVRAYAPFPKLPSIACKYRIQGIRPKNGEQAYKTEVLDIIHKTIVDKLVSVRVSTTEFSKSVKYCSIRVGATDLAQYLIDGGYADPDNRLPDRPKASDISARHNSLPFYNKLHTLIEAKSDQENHMSREGSGVERKSLFASVQKGLAMSCVEDEEFDIKHPQTKSNDDDADAEDDIDADDVNDCLDQLLHCLDKNELDLDTNMYNELKGVLTHDQHQQTFIPPAKKRMFDSHDYKQMHNQIHLDNLFNPIDDDEAMDCEGVGGDNNGSDICGGALGIDDDDQDIVELEQSFAHNYWHAGEDEVVVEDDKEKNQPTERRTTKHHQDLESSEFAKFRPNETSSVFSHFSGIESFKSPQLPAGMRSFNCTVVAVITPVTLEIFPHLTEFEYRKVELQRRIKHLVKSAPPLTQYEPRTVCLACYTKDKKWYRALIRSYNPAAKQVDVLYVDYLNTESLPIDQLKECPVELVGWPLRTFRVRLHGLQQNQRMREKDVCQALGATIGSRQLFARIKKEPGVCSDVDELLSGTSSGSGADATLMEIDLYESKDTAASSPIYEHLVQKNFYSRI